MAAQGKRSTPSASRLRRLVKPVLIIGVVLALLGVLLVAVLYKSIDVPNPNKDFETETTHVYYRGGKQEVGQFALQKRDRIPYSEMPQVVKDAVVAAEDRTFWTNGGIDLKGILRAALSNAKGNDTQGASTITQQYVKILYLSSEHSYKRKIKEAIVAKKINREMSKQEVLEGYLNTIYFGRGAYGIQAASASWFHEDAKDLNLRQGVMLASILNNPTLYNPDNGKANAAALLERMNRVLNGMVSMGKITRIEADEAGKQLPHFTANRSGSVFSGQRGHAMSLVKSELLRLGVATESEIDGGGLKVYTTLDKKVMKADEDAINEIRPKGLDQLHTAIANVEPGTGALRGFYGGQDYLKSQLNWALAGDKVGSSFKPFALAAGLEAGYSLKDTFDGNSPYYYNGQGTGAFVSNEDAGHDWGPVNLIKATEQSINSAFADLTMSIPDGPDKIRNTAYALGIPKATDKNSVNNMYKSPGLDAVSGIALGSATIAPVNMANAYASIANKGQAAKLYVIDKVVDRDGKVLYKHRTQTHEAIREDVAADVTYAMQQVIKSGTGTAAGALGRPAAGKTGTATSEDPNGGHDFTSSAWFVGFTPQLSTAVMYNRTGDRGQPLPLAGYISSEFGGHYPAMTWAAAMREALDGEPVLPLPPPAYVDGDAPESGHAPKPNKAPTCKSGQKPSVDDCVAPAKTATATATAKASKTATASPTPTQSPTKNVPPPKDPCNELLPPATCSPSPTDTTTASASPAGNGNGPPGP
ncbi:transglycosylase domain-containing protein [Nocardioides jiangxiensis]|uniref:Transglycosylase domain-containing protein n=1 Tax=Nocardioides jiangxiensis TaxID=3064524 RepID=A0ABT9B0I7_9ACTN|nr:transglycosylase domain-containing protein [Nocardioides sp. WY-20]MDO7868193.1 transglycosylase domain-containing protein [Nocardioides sp. WY-20]